MLLEKAAKSATLGLKKGGTKYLLHIALVHEFALLFRWEGILLQAHKILA